MRQYDAAIRLARSTLGKGAGDEMLHWIIWRALHQKGMHREALTEARTIFATDSAVLDALSRGYASGGYREANRLAAQTLSTRRNMNFGELENTAILWAFAGEKAPALDWLERNYEKHHAMMSFISIDPHWDVVRSEPRFRELLRKLKLPDISPSTVHG